MTLKLKDFEIGGDKLTVLAGPCAIESLDVMRRTAEGLKTVCEKLDINYVFKSSYDISWSWYGKRLRVISSNKERV